MRWSRCSGAASTSSIVSPSMDTWTLWRPGSLPSQLLIAETIGRRSNGSIPDSIQEQTEAAIRRIEEILRVEDLDLSGPSWHTTPASLGEGLAMLRAAREYDLEGVVAKRLDGRYLPGRRSRSWVKVKRFQRAEGVVIGWVPWRNGLSGPLAVGQRIDGGSAQVRFAGVVEAGFSEGDRAELGRRLVDLQDPTARPWREHRGQPLYPVRPELTVEVQLLEWTALGQARHMSYKGIARQ